MGNGSHLQAQLQCGLTLGSDVNDATIVAERHGSFTEVQLVQGTRLRGVAEP